MFEQPRIVITGLGLTAPNGNSLGEYRANLLGGVARIAEIEVRYMGRHPAGVCDFDARKYQSRKELRTSTRAGSIGIFCAHEALLDAGYAVTEENRHRIGVYVGTTEHGNVETENEIHSISQFNYDTKFWTHHHNPRTVANNPAGEVTMGLKITGPHYCIGAACAAGNAGLIQGGQQLILGEVDMAIAGGVSESIPTFGNVAGLQKH
ncbi:MAG: beta-ketoacyl synthase N-terminal-like domain-containing protein, partial [Opitutales bacterium]